MKILLYAGDDLPDRGKQAVERERTSFVIDCFRRVLSGIAETHDVTGYGQIETIRASCEAQGRSCIVLSFVPPHETTLFARAAVVPVVAWGYDRIPCEVWDGQPKHDWRMVLQQTGRAVALSEHTAAAIRRAVGENFPVTTLPPPVFDRMAELRARIGEQRPSPQVLRIRGIVVDTAKLALSPSMTTPPAPVTANVATATRWTKNVVGAYRTHVRRHAPASVRRLTSRMGGAAWRTAQLFRAAPGSPRPSLRRRLSSVHYHGRAIYREAVGDLVPSWLHRTLAGGRLGRLASAKPAPEAAASLEAIADDEMSGTEAVTLDGVVYLATIDPAERRQNFADIVSAFAWGVRDKPDATLVISTTPQGVERYWEALFNELRKQPAYRCRVVLLAASLDRGQADALLAATSYVVDASLCEGVGAPLLQAMSVGRPAIAPDHTAMASFIDAGNAFVLRSDLEVTVFPHDGAVRPRALWHQLQWDSLCQAFRESYDLVKDDPERWLSMAAHAIATQRAHCADALVERRLRDVLGLRREVRPLTEAPARAAPATGRPVITA